MDPCPDEVLSELLSICHACRGHGGNSDSYTSPGFSEYLNRALTISDIPMQSYNIEKTSRKDPNSVPWEDSIKNFIFDMTSFNTSKKFSICILLVEMGYKYTSTTLELISKKYCNPNSVMISVEMMYAEGSDSDSSDTDDILFKVNIVRNSIVEYTAEVLPNYLVSSLITWYIPNSTAILCHDYAVKQYKNCISMMPETIWSISCTPTNFIECKKSNVNCKYICPTYSCLGSLETRAVGLGPIKETSHRVSTIYEGKLNYYLRCVRGSKHSSGRCFDCQSLFKVVTSVYKSPDCSPIKMSSATFTSDFLLSASRIN